MNYNDFIRPHLKELVPYIPGKSPSELATGQPMIKLASNENPLGPAVPVDEWPGLLENMNIYPYYSGHPFIQKLADKHNVRTDNVILGNGSDEIITMVALAFMSGSDEVLTGDITFSQYHFAAQLAGAKFKTVPMIDGGFDCDNILSCLSPATKVIYIANPNNPTGTLIDYKRLCAFMEELPPHVLVVFDEAYYEYVEPEYPTTDLLACYANLLITRTFSKAYGLAALRVGYGLGNSELIRCLNKVRQPFNVNGVALAIAEAALERDAFISETVALNRSGKRYLCDYFSEHELNYFPSQANFICVDVQASASQIEEKLIQRGFIVRQLTGFGLPNHIRVTVGSDVQNRQFTTALTAIMKEVQNGSTNNII